jgi:hypothetical protein
MADIVGLSGRLHRYVLQLKNENEAGCISKSSASSDVEGSQDSSGHVYALPAKACYIDTPKESSGVLLFNAKKCYGDSF